MDVGDIFGLRSSGSRSSAAGSTGSRGTSGTSRPTATSTERSREQRGNLEDRDVTPGMESLIPVINKLQDVFSAVGSDPLDLPQIVVVGTQSAGKSSVLENIVGRDFLPRGSGIVTRRPLVLQLINMSSSSSERHQEWGEFLHKPNEMYYDFEEIRQEIARETDRITGRNKGISPMPINLKIYSPHVLNLTLVDLPGVTRIAIGDQPKDIEKQIRAMIMNYIGRKNSIILAVSPANADLATSDSLQMAREVDPDGRRTVGVVTKIDLMDKGTDALETLLGRVHPLRLGYVGVINRSQQDIDSKKSIRDALKNESEFFQSHPMYRSIAARCGTQFLSRQLNKILLNHIRNTVPELKTKINKMIAEAQGELQTLGDPSMDGKNSMGALLLQIITKFSTEYRNAIDGRSTVDTSELYGGARINMIFTEVFGRHVQLIAAGEGINIEDIRVAIRNATGPKAALFIPESAFEMLVKRQILRLEDPALSCVDSVYDELQQIVSAVEVKELTRFAGLRERLTEVVNHLLAKCRLPTRQMISNLINIELAYINTNHPDFVGGDGAAGQIFSQMARSSDDAQQQQMMQQQQQQMAQQQAQQQAQQAQGQGQGQITNAQAVGHLASAASQQVRGARQGENANFFSTFFGGQGQQGQPGQPQQVQPAQPQQPTTTKTKTSSRTQAARSRPSQQPPSQPTSGFTVSTSGHKMSDKEKFETEIIVSLLVSYFDVVKKNVLDLIPKSIMHFLVNQSKETIQNELVANLYKEELFEELLEENSGTAERRRQVKSMLTILQRANAILNEVRDTSV